MPRSSAPAAGHPTGPTTATAAQPPGHQATAPAAPAQPAAATAASTQPTDFAQPVRPAAAPGPGIGYEITVTRNGQPWVSMSGTGSLPEIAAQLRHVAHTVQGVQSGPHPEPADTRRFSAAREQSSAAVTAEGSAAPAISPVTALEADQQWRAFETYYATEPYAARAELENYLNEMQTAMPDYVTDLKQAAGEAENLAEWFLANPQAAHCIHHAHVTGHPELAQAVPGIYQNGAGAAALAGLGFANLTSAAVKPARGRHRAPKTSRVERRRLDLAAAAAPGR